MNVSSAIRPAGRAAFRALIDYAGLFPPAQRSMNDAQSEYRTARGGSHAWMLGRFIIPASQLIEVSALEGPFSVIADGAPATLEAVAALQESGAPIGALEIPLPKHVTFDRVADALDALREAITSARLDPVPIFVEIPRTERWPEIVPRAMTALRSRGFGAKLRCGGVTAGAFPTVDEVAEFVAHAVENGVPFKATAGLHHPVRHLDKASGFTMHGFLNIIAAAAFAARVERDTLVRIVAEENADAFVFDDSSFAWRDERIGDAQLQKVRSDVFVSYGSCSFVEPINDLTALGLLPSQ
jgi:hypothetical protein